MIAFIKKKLFKSKVKIKFNAGNTAVISVFLAVLLQIIRYSYSQFL